MKVNDLFENNNVDEMADTFIEHLKNSSFADIGVFNDILRHIKWFNENHNGQTPEKYQNYLIQRGGVSSRNVALISNPNVKLQDYAYRECNPITWMHLKQIDNTILKKMLTDVTKIDDYGDQWDQFVKAKFANNQILMNKWLKYGKSVREGQ